jgi:hypothetical protein
LKSDKVVVIHQPDFSPYLGFFHRLLHCDLFVILDHVQLLVKGWHNRDQIKGADGKHWLTVPINREVKNPPINQARIDDTKDWRTKHLKTIGHFYMKAPFFEEVFPEIKKIYDQNHSLLIDLNMALMRFYLAFFGVRVEMVFSSDLKSSSQKSQLILDLVLATGGTRYLSGTGAKDYLEKSLFDQAGIKLNWQEFIHPVYPQLHGNFIPYLSCLDFAMNCGPYLRDYLEK